MIYEKNYLFHFYFPAILKNILSSDCLRVRRLKLELQAKNSTLFIFFSFLFYIIQSLLMKKILNAFSKKNFLF